MARHFQPIPGVLAILRSRGVYREAQVYRKHMALFARYGGGYVKLLSGGTSNPAVNWTEMDEHPDIDRKKLRWVGPTG